MHQTIFHRYRSLVKRVGVLALTSAIFASGLSQISHAQNSPEGTWDFSLSNAKRGTAIIVFNDDFTLEGYEVVSQKGRRKSSSDSDRRPGRPNPVRGEGSGSSEPGTNEATQAIEAPQEADTVKTVGSAELNGLWTYDEKGRVVGFFEATFALITGESIELITNAVSFRAIVRPGQRINLLATTEEGRVAYRGTPSDPTDISGNYIASTKTRDGSELIQFVQLSPGILPGEFDLVGTGPGYDVFGSALLTSRGQISLVILGDDGSLAAATGRYSTQRNTAKLRGTNGDDKSITIRLVPDVFGLD